MKLLSWNVNGIRAVQKKGFLDWFYSQDFDILAIQETKAHPDQLGAELKEIPEMYTDFSSAEKKGYSGVAIYSREHPLKTDKGFGIEKFDSEGRILFLEYENFFLYNIYYPNGQMSDERLNYKLEFYDAFLEHVEKTRKQGKAVLICGDFNTAHREIDLARPRENENTSGFLPIERAWMDQFSSAGYIDTFRMFHSDGNHYSWWSMRSRARERNVGWRIDYFFINEEHKDLVKDAFILTEVEGSDHCPVGIEIEFA